MRDRPLSLTRHPSHVRKANIAENNKGAEVVAADSQSDDLLIRQISQMTPTESSDTVLVLFNIDLRAI